MRFQPRIGQLLAAAAENVVSIFDVETDRQTHSLRVGYHYQIQKKLESIRTPLSNIYIITFFSMGLCCFKRALPPPPPLKKKKTDSNMQLLILMCGLLDFRGTLQQSTLFVGTQLEIIWHLQVKSPSGCGL